MIYKKSVNNSNMKRKFGIEPMFLTVQQVAAMGGFSPHIIYSWIRRGKVIKPEYFKRFGNGKYARIRFYADKIDEWL